MTRQFIGCLLFVCGLFLLLSDSVASYTGPRWSSLSAVDMAAIQGGACAYDDDIECESHDDDCGTACEDHDSDPNTEVVCVRRNDRQYIEDTSESTYAVCKYSSSESGYVLCQSDQTDPEVSKTTVNCWQSHLCGSNCDLNSQSQYECQKEGSDVQNEDIHDNWLKDTGSGSCSASS